MISVKGIEHGLIYRTSNKTSIEDKNYQITYLLRVKNIEKNIL